jgi:hypothetical protein
MQAIVTKYLRPTNHRGARVKATCQARSYVIPYDHALDAPDNHRVAAMNLAVLMQWEGIWIGGGMPADSGYAFLCVEGGGPFHFEVENLGSSYQGKVPK